MFQVSSSRTSVTSIPPHTHTNFFMPHSQRQPQASSPSKPVFPLIASPSDLPSPSMTSHPSLTMHTGVQQLNGATPLAPNPLSPPLSPHGHSLSVSLFFQHSHSLSTLHSYMQRSQQPTQPMPLTHHQALCFCLCYRRRHPCARWKR
jgi:hypothetical protein